MRSSSVAKRAGLGCVAIRSPGWLVAAQYAPRWIASAASWDLELMLSLAKMCTRWVLTVAREMNSCCAIWGFDKCRATSLAI